jgi:subtilisin family serine protease
LVEAVAAGDNHAIVAFKEPGSARVKDTGLRAAVTAATVAAGVRMVEGQGGEVTADLRNMGAVVVRMPPALAPALSRHPLVDYVEPRQRYELDALPMRVPALTVQGGQTQPWGINMIGAPWVWSTTTTGSGENGGVKVLVIDAPYSRGHEDLPVIPLANCGNGGCDSGTNSHGTFVLGEIVARNNSLGIVGAAHGVEDVNVYFWAGCSSGTIQCFPDQVADGIDEGITWGVDVINMSLGGEYDLGKL